MQVLLRREIMRKTVVLGTAALFVLGFGTSALAASPSQFYDGGVSVSFSDLDINKAAGAKVLYSRLQRASESVCNVESYRELGSLSRVAQAERCYRETLDKAVAKIDSAALNKIHSG
jgi:UrcA family protein